MSEFHHANEIEKHYSWYFCSISQSSQEFLASVQNEAKIIEFYIRLRDDLSKTRKLLLSSKKKFPLKCDYYEEIFCGRIKSDNLNCSLKSVWWMWREAITQISISSDTIYK